MPQHPVETNDRLLLRIATEAKSLLIREAALQHMNLTEFVIRHSVSVARKVIEENERVQLTEQYSLLIMNLLDHPPYDKLMAAACALPHSS